MTIILVVIASHLFERVNYRTHNFRTVGVTHSNVRYVLTTFLLSVSGERKHSFTAVQVITLAIRRPGF